MEKNGNGYDCTDKALRSYNLCRSIANSMFSIFLHCVDMGYDLYVAYSYFESSKYSYGAWSVALILFPSIALAAISIKMYVDDVFKNRMEFSSALSRVILCIFGLPIQSAPLIRTVDSLYLASKLKAPEQSDQSQEGRRELLDLNQEGRRELPDLSQEGRRELEENIRRILEEESDISFLKVFEAYLESAPQQVLQMTLLIADASQGLFDDSYKQGISIFLGFCSMSYSMANYNRCIRLDQENKENVTDSGAVVHFLWHLLFIVSRILSVSAVASLYPFWTCVAIGIHWLIASTVLTLLKTHAFCSLKFLDVLFACTVGAVYIFNFLSLKDGKKKYYYLVFYTIIFVENTVAVVIWILNSGFKNWVYYIFAILPNVCFILGLIFMILYYKCFHPTLTQTSVQSNVQNQILSDDGRVHNGNPVPHKK